MRTIYIAISAFVFGLLSQSVAAIEESALVKSMLPGPFILPAPEGTWTWGMAPIYDDNGKVHVFNSIIPKNGRWTKHSKIVHWIADKPEGPYTLLGDVLVSDSASYHNPQISKVGDTFVLVFLLNRYKDENGSKQEVGIATTQSLMGPWIESPHNPIIKATPENGEHASNPTFVVAPDGEYRIYHKTMTTHEGEIYREISLATSNNIEGPYRVSEKGPVITYAEQKVDIEDPYAFYYNGMYYMILEDRQDVSALLEGKHTGDAKKGGWRPGLLYKSKDGLDWGTPSEAYKTNQIYYGHKLARSERPSILWKNGKPDYLYLACHDDDSSAGYILKINGWEGE
ncbi:MULTISPECIES: glycoside hydrolase family protein [Aliiglaciecola]|uniref:glycoside hydrolase family protein n=1 Tax=Aliiglaciecola TaxID=1406885 RepID=UPI001C09F2A9|nr:MULTISPECIES: glycoside hydrolase family protein [Aliiglaciecola]MBU2877933.1 glycoside hydrolase family protein [Aliiglaciecola lipolytica]MDO6709298.1 glycoside hydrolase family protein [Aliiglaciecola sp. 2_MG-2023]MDO6750446.1 glycoside hydrolase family protein [Aliiglaciecola sp. 1_MG-2023]